MFKKQAMSDWAAEQEASLSGAIGVSVGWFDWSVFWGWERVLAESGNRQGVAVCGRRDSLISRKRQTVIGFRSIECRLRGTVLDKRANDQKRVCNWMFRRVVGGQRRKTDSFSFGQCADSSFAHCPEQTGWMGRKRVLHFQSAAVFAASEYYWTPVAKDKIWMAQAGRLSFIWEFDHSHQRNTEKCRSAIQD